MKSNHRYLAWTAAEFLRCFLLASMIKSIIAIPLQDTLFFTSFGGVQLVFPLFGMLLFLGAGRYSAFSRPLGALKFALAIPFAAFAVTRFGSAVIQNTLQGQELFFVSMVFMIVTDFSGGFFLLKTGKAARSAGNGHALREIESRDGHGLPAEEITAIADGAQNESKVPDTAP